MATIKKGKKGYINMQKSDKGLLKKWKSYRFEVTKIYLLYYKSEIATKPDGQILLSSVTKLEMDSTKGATFPLQVHFKGKPEEGVKSPWTLDLTSNDERIEWMELIKPGSSAELQRFTKSDSLHRMNPLHSPTYSSYDPYSLVDNDPSVRNGTYTCTLHDSADSTCPQESGRYQQPPQPQNYIEPTHIDKTLNFPVGSNTQPVINRNNQSMQHQNVTMSVDGTLNPASKKTISYAKSMYVPSSSVEHVPPVARSNTVKSPDHPSRNYNHPHPSRSHDHPKSPEHLYEVDFLESRDVMSRPPPPEKPPPKVKPRVNKRPPPQLGAKESTQHVETKYVSDNPDEAEPRYTTRVDTLGKEPDYCLMYPSPRPVPRERTKKTSSSDINSNCHRPEQCVRAVKPMVVPRKNISPHKSHDKQQPEYLHIIDGDKSEPKSNENRSSGKGDAVVEMVQNLNPDQVANLIRMLQQVKADGDQSRIVGPTVDSSHQGDKSGEFLMPMSPPEQSNYTQLRDGFERVINYTPLLQTDRILVTDDDDDKGYEPRPDWAKVKSTTDNQQSYPDTLSSLQEEALYIPRSRLTDFIIIGEGNFGKVFRASMKRGTIPISVAVKTAKKNTSVKEQKEFQREMSIMSQMVHPNIVQLYGIIKDDVPAPWIVLEYLCHGDIKHFLLENKRPVEKLIKYMLDVSMGMHYLTEKGLVHRDLAARNVLVGENETCKVSDFGLLRELPKDDSVYFTQTNVPFPVRWMPPESIAERVFSPASDVWSFGVLQWEMFYPDKTPYGSLGNMQVALEVMGGRRLEIPQLCPPLVARIMKACWHKEPDRRPSFLLITTLLTTKVIIPNENE